MANFTENRTTLRGVCRRIVCEEYMTERICTIMTKIVEVNENDGIIVNVESELCTLLSLSLYEWRLKRERGKERKKRNRIKK